MKSFHKTGRIPQVLLSRHFNDDRFALDLITELGHQSGGFGNAGDRLQLDDENLAEHLVIQRFDYSLVAFSIEVFLELLGFLPVYK